MNDFPTFLKIVAMKSVAFSLLANVMKTGQKITLPMTKNLETLLQDLTVPFPTDNDVRFHYVVTDADDLVADGCVKLSFVKHTLPEYAYRPYDLVIEVNKTDIIKCLQMQKPHYWLEEAFRYALHTTAQMVDIKATKFLDRDIEHRFPKIITTKTWFYKYSKNPTVLLNLLEMTKATQNLATKFNEATAQVPLLGSALAGLEMTNPVPNEIKDTVTMP